MSTTIVDFTADSAVQALGDGRYAAHVTPHWSAPIGPNGGYIAAIIVRAIEAEVAAPALHIRTLTLHYLRSPAVDADAQVEVTVERAGRTVTTVVARFLQDDRVCVLALASLATSFPDAITYRTPPPDVPAFAGLDPITPPAEAPEIAHRLDVRYALGPPPFRGADEAVSGGWLRLTNPPRAVDAALLALLVDAWLPTAWFRLSGPVPAPTVELTIHFRAPLVALTLDASDPLLVRFSSRTAHDGLFEEDGEVWGPGGVLLAHSRQLALMRVTNEEIP